MESAWKCVLELGSQRLVTGGSPAALRDAIRRGADLRIYTEFIHNEHIDPSSDNPERIKEVSEFAATYLIDDRWVAGIMTLRQPISIPDGFGPRPSMSFFMYNEDGQQAIARPFLDGAPAAGVLGPAALDDRSDMPKYHQMDNWDADSNGPSHNFIYDFEVFRYDVCDNWTELLAHDARGVTLAGSVDALTDAFAQGCEVKVGIRTLCADLAGDRGTAPDHELFIKAGPGYYYTDQKLFLTGSHPVVRVAPAIPMRYSSRNWDFGWLMPRSDGFVAQLIYDPYTLRHRRTGGHYGIRWFVR